MEAAALSAFFVFAVLVIMAVMLITALLEWLWNITIPDIFGIREISFWEAFRLMLISALLFGAPYASVNFQG